MAKDITYNGKAYPGLTMKKILSDRINVYYEGRPFAVLRGSVVGSAFKWTAFVDGNIRSTTTSTQRQAAVQAFNRARLLGEV